MSTIIEKVKGPSQGGVTHGYIPEYYDVQNDKWRPITIMAQSDIRAQGVPWPSWYSVEKCLAMFGYEQAMALAYEYAAVERFKQHVAPRVRLCQYEIKYEISSVVKCQDYQPENRMFNAP